MKSKRRRKGVLVTTEALLVGFLLALIISILGMYTLRNITVGSGKITQTTVDGSLCGEVLIVKNVGKQPAKIKFANGISPNADITSQLGLPVTLGPGETREFHLNTVYGEVVLSGDNFRTVYIKNDCSG